MSEAFVGRAAELGQLEDALDAARAGHGSTVLVGGEAGIGKTRLAAELAARARDAGVEVLLGRSIDLVGTELSYQPFVEALRALGGPWHLGAGRAGSQLHVFEQTLALLTDRAAAAPVLLVLEDLHWADTSTLDLVVFLAHSIDDRAILVVGTFRADEPSSADRMRHLVDGIRRSGSAVVIELGPLQRDELTWLLAARAGGSVPAELANTIADRSEGNPFFAEELLAAAGDGGGVLRRHLRDLLLQRLSMLDLRTASLLRVASAAGRDVGYAPRCCAVAELPERTVRTSLRRAVEHGVLVVDQASDSFRFRHPLLREAVYSTLLPGEREELHARLAEALTRSAAAEAAELAPQWAAAGRVREALVASVEAARQAEAVFGLAEGAGAPGPGARVVGRRSGRSRARGTRPRRAALPGSRARQPDRRGAARGRACPQARSSWWATGIRCVRRGSTTSSAVICTRAGGPTPPSPPSSAWSTSCRRGLPRRGGPTRSRRSGTD